MPASDLWLVESQTGLLEDIGRVTVRWSAIDLCLVELASIALMNRPAAVEIVLNGTGAGRQRIEAFNAVIGSSYFDERERKMILGITSRLLGLLKVRNGIVHSPLVVTYNVSGRKLSSKLMKVGKRGTQSSVARDDITRHIDDVGRALDKLDEIAAELQEKYLSTVDEGEDDRA